MINECFDGRKYETVNSFFKVFFDDVLSKELRHVLEEERIVTRPFKDCRIRLRFRKAFESEVSNVLKL